MDGGRKYYLFEHIQFIIPFLHSKKYRETSPPVVNWEVTPTIDEQEQDLLEHNNITADDVDVDADVEEQEAAAVAKLMAAAAEDLQQHIEYMDNNTRNSCTSTSPAFAAPPSKKRKFEYDYLVGRRVDVANSMEMFLLSLLPDVHRLRDEQTRFFRIKVLTVINDLIEEQEQEPPFDRKTSSPRLANKRNCKDVENNNCNEASFRTEVSSNLPLNQHPADMDMYSEENAGEESDNNHGDSSTSDIEDIPVVDTGTGTDYEYEANAKTSTSTICSTIRRNNSRRNSNKPVSRPSLQTHIKKNGTGNNNSRNVGMGINKIASSSSRMSSGSREKYFNNILMETAVSNLSKTKDQYDIFAAHVACELRNLSSDFLRKKLKRKIQQSIVDVTEEEERLTDPSNAVNSSNNFMSINEANSSNNYVSENEANSSHNYAPENDNISKIEIVLDPCSPTTI